MRTFWETNPVGEEGDWHVGMSSVEVRQRAAEGVAGAGDGDLGDNGEERRAVRRDGSEHVHCGAAEEYGSQVHTGGGACEEVAQVVVEVFVWSV